MKVLTARYADGRLDLPEGSIPEGEVVTLLVPEDRAGFRLTPDERSRLAASIAQAERGEVRVVGDAAEVLGLWHTSRGEAPPLR